MGVQIILKDKWIRKPIPSVRVHIYNEKHHFFDDTNNNGIAEFPNINDGVYIITVKDSEYRPFHQKVFLSRNSIVYITLEPARV